MSNSHLLKLCEWLNSAHIQNTLKHKFSLPRERNTPQQQASCGGGLATRSTSAQLFCQALWAVSKIATWIKQFSPGNKQIPWGILSFCSLPQDTPPLFGYPIMNGSLSHHSLFHFPNPGLVAVCWWLCTWSPAPLWKISDFCTPVNISNSLILDIL